MLKFIINSFKKGHAGAKARHQDHKERWLRKIELCKMQLLDVRIDHISRYDKIVSMMNTLEVASSRHYLVQVVAHLVLRIEELERSNSERNIQIK